MFESLLSGADNTYAILVLSAGNIHFLVVVADFTSFSLVIYESAPNTTTSICKDFSKRISFLISGESAERYPAFAARDWQVVFAEVKTQHPTENNCAIFSSFHVLVVIQVLRPCDNILAPCGFAGFPF